MRIREPTQRERFRPGRQFRNDAGVLALAVDIEATQQVLSRMFAPAACGTAPGGLNLKTSLQATEITEGTEKTRLAGSKTPHPAGEHTSIGASSVFLCELCALCG